MVARGKRAEDAAGDDGAIHIKFQLGPAMKALVLALASLLGVGGAGFWQSRNASAKAAEEMVAMTDALTALQGEVATLKGTFVTRLESDAQHALIARDAAAADELLARDVASLNDRLRDVRRGERRTR